MIAQVLRLTRWEWFKLRKRWMPWILLGIIVLISQLPLWGSFLAYHNETIRSFFSGASFYSASTLTDDGIVSIELTCDDVAEGRVAEKVAALPEDFQERLGDDIREFREDCAGFAVLEEFREGFTLPSSITGGIEVAYLVVGILILILTGSVAGSEYGWGTLRNALTRGVGRWQLLASKLFLLLLLGAGGLFVVAVLITISSLIAAVISPDEAGGLFGSGQWSEVAVMFGKAVYGMVPYITLATFLAVLSQSSSKGISLATGYYVIELVTAPIFLLIPRFQSVPDYLIGQNVNVWMSQTAVFSAEVTSDGVPLEQPDTLHAFSVLLTYILVLGLATFWLFQRRDVAGAKGE